MSHVRHRLYLTAVALAPLLFLLGLHRWPKWLTALATEGAKP